MFDIFFWNCKLLFLPREERYRLRFMLADQILTNLEPILWEERRLLWSMIKIRNYGLRDWTYERIDYFKRRETRWLDVRAHMMKRLGYSSLDDARWHLVTKPSIRHYGPATAA